MQYYTCCIPDFMLALSHENKSLFRKNPLKVIYSGDGCHETYKDKNNNWLSPNEVFSEDGKKFF